MHHGQRHFLLLGGGRPGWRVRVEREFGSHLMEIRIATDRSRQLAYRATATDRQDTKRACLGAVPHIKQQDAPQDTAATGLREVVYGARSNGPVRSSGSVVGGCVGRKNRRAAASS
ncbi:hypothetical protein CEJ63_25280, partial [Acinetobacter baumannii]